MATILVIGIVLLLGACAGQQSQNPGGDPDSPVTSSPDPGGPAPGPTPLMVTPRPGLVDPRPRSWESLEVVDERTLLMQFYGGVEECYGLHHVDTEYGSDSITITLYEGRVRDAGVCIELAVLKEVRIELDEPLGGREIVDGGPGILGNTRGDRPHPTPKGREQIGRGSGMEPLVSGDTYK
ncbi:MAG: hypothetical protein ACRDGU_02330 [Actinomycetota bacterium]